MSADHEEAYIRAWQERDAQRRRAEAAEARGAELERELKHAVEWKHKQAADIMTLGALVYDGSEQHVTWKSRAEAAEAEIVDLRVNLASADDIIADLRARLAAACQQRDLAEIKRADTERMFEAALAKAREALRMLMDEKIDYMKINNLGDPETQHTIKVARAALAGERHE